MYLRSAHHSHLSLTLPLTHTHTRTFFLSSSCSSPPSLLLPSPTSCIQAVCARRLQIEWLLGRCSYSTLTRHPCHQPPLPTERRDPHRHHLLHLLHHRLRQLLRQEIMSDSERENDDVYIIIRFLFLVQFLCLYLVRNYAYHNEVPETNNQR